MLKIKSVKKKKNDDNNVLFIPIDITESNIKSVMIKKEKNHTTGKKYHNYCIIPTIQCVF